MCGKNEDELLITSTSLLLKKAKKNSTEDPNFNQLPPLLFGHLRFERGSYPDLNVVRMDLDAVHRDLPPRKILRLTTNKS